VIKCYKVLILLFLGNILLWANTDTDLLIKQFKNSTDEGAEQILLEAQNLLDDMDLDPALEFSNELLNYTVKPVLKAKISNMIANKLNFSNELTEAQKYFELTLEVLERDPSFIETAAAYRGLASIYSDRLLYTESLDYYLEAEKIYSQLGEVENQADLLNNLGIVYENLSIYDEAVMNYFRSLMLYESIESQEGIANSYVNIGNIYQTMSNLDRALDFYKQALVIYRETDDDYGISNCLNNMGIIYDNLQDYHRALSYYQESLDLAIEMDDEIGIATTLNNIAIVYNELGEFRNSLDCYQKSLEKSRTLDDKWAIANTLSNLGELYIDYEDFQHGLDYLNQGLDISKEYNFTDLLMEGYNITAKYYSVIGDFEQAFLNYQNYVSIKDSLIANSSTRIAEIQNYYESQKHSREIELLSIKEDNHNMIRMILVVAALIFLIIIVILIIAYRKKNKEVIKRRTLEKNILKLASIVNQAEVSIILTDLNGEIQYVNRFFEKHTGYTLEDVHNLTPGILKAGFTDKEVYKELWETINTGQVWKGNFLNKKKNSDLFYEEAVIFPIKDEKGQLINFAAVKKDITEQLKAQHELQASELRFRMMAKKITDGLLILENFTFIYMNDKMEKITGYSLAEIKNMQIKTIIVERDRFRIARMMAKARQNPEQIKSFELWITTKSGEERCISCGSSYSKISDDKMEVYIIVSDITERKQSEEKLLRSLQEKEVLIKEIHHRVKNNMQVVSSLLQLQSRYITDPETLDLFRKSQSRVRSMSLIHEKLYRSEDLAHINFQDYIRKLSHYLMIFYSVDMIKIRVEYDIDDILLDINQAIPLGLITNELLSNCLKYAFSGRQEGLVTITLKKKDNIIKLSIVDNGVGIPDDFDLEGSDTLGLQLVRSLTEQLHGEFNYSNEDGTNFKLQFSESDPLSLTDN